MRLANFEGILRFHVPSIVLTDLLGNTCLSLRVQKVMVCDWWLVDFDPFFFCFALRGSLLFVIVLFLAIIGWLSLLRSYFWSFLLLSLARIKQRLRSSFDKNSTHQRDFLCYSWRARVILSQAGRARYIVIFINPAFTNMIDGKSLRSLQCSRRDTTSFAVIFIYVKQSIQKTDKWKYWFLRGWENRSTRRKNLSEQG